MGGKIRFEKLYCERKGVDRAINTPRISYFHMLGSVACRAQTTAAKKTLSLGRVGGSAQLTQHNTAITERASIDHMRSISLMNEFEHPKGLGTN